MGTGKSRLSDAPLPQLSFCHVPKTAGQAVLKGLRRNSKLKKRIQFLPHGVCPHDKPTVAIIRNPVDRFVSVFNFCKFGSVRPHKITETAIDMHKHRNDYPDDINLFIKKLRALDHDAVLVFIGGSNGHCDMGHWASQVDMASPSTRFVCYSKDASTLESNLSAAFGASFKLPVANITEWRENVASRNDLTADSLDWIETTYRRDVDLYKSLCNEKRGGASTSLVSW